MREKRKAGSYLRLALLAALVAAAALPMHALEHVTLRNGFTLDCVRQQPVGDHVRLYIAPQNYIEVLRADIASVESLPDPPKQPSSRVGNPLPAQTAVTAPARLTLEEMHPLLAKAGTQHNIDTDLLWSVVKAESNGQMHAVSRAGAQGLMQLMPQTAAQMGVQNSFQPAQNIAGGAAYLDQMLTRYHNNLMLALAAYNAGPAAVDRWHGIPPYRETRAYVARVVREFNRRKRMQMQKTQLASTK
ncbi:MAG: lytic transglycosylase domain-containing protein [Acidobacteriaceae bacterium]